MTVEDAIVEESITLWRRRAFGRASEPLRLGRRLRPRAASPGAWLKAVRAAHHAFLVEVGSENGAERTHIDAFFAQLSTVTASPAPRPLSAESSHAA